MKVVDVRFAQHREPFGIGEARPPISWRTTGTSRTQVAYEIEVVRDGGSTATSRIEGSGSLLVPWPDEPLRSREGAQVRVRVWADGGAPSDWSDPVRVEVGLLEPVEWEGIAAAPPPAPHGGAPRAATLLRRELEVDGELAGARLYVTAHGLYELELDGERVGDHVLAPGWTSYRHRLRYQTFDVTERLTPGTHVLGAWLGDGWFRGRIGFEGGRWDYYGDRTALLAQLELHYVDGRSERVTTADGWTWHPAPLTAAGLYEGERYDARAELADWSRPGGSDEGWLPTESLPIDTATLVAPDGPPVRVIETLSPVAIEPRGEGTWLVDLGQNISGRLRIRPRGPAGTTITLRHAEVFEPDGSLALRPLRTADALDEYTCRGDEDGWWEPRFTLHGFRYAEVSGWPGELTAADLTAVVVHSDMARAGWFTCSDPDLERLHENVVWSMRDNFVDVPTDCPQRDERLGWTGDIQVFTPTAAFLYSAGGVLRSWLKDLAVEQAELGTAPVYVPWIQLLFPVAPTAAWGDAAVVVPWELYRRTGDEGFLRDQYASMTAWVDEIAAVAGPGHLWASGFQLGDWLDPAAPPDRPADARTDKFLVSAAYHAYTARLVARTAGALGLSDDEARYGALADAAREAFRREFVSPSGRLVSDAQTAYAVALQFDLLTEPAEREHAGARLVELVTQGGFHIQTGFVGTPLVCDALASVGALDTAYQLLGQRSCPSWLYPVTMGATTIWERWDSLLPDGSVNPGEMTSFNHYALGAVADFMHRVVAGLAPVEPGYRTFRVAPRPGGGLTHASARHLTPFGLAEVSWRRDGERLEVDVLVPVGTTAVVDLPGGTTGELSPGEHRLSGDVRAADQDPPIPAPRNIFDVA